MQCNYFEQLTKALEASHRAKKAEIKKLKILLIQVDQDKNEEIEKVINQQKSFGISAVRILGLNKYHFYNLHR